MHDMIAAQGSFIGSMFLMGLAGGLTHCTGMCGPFVLAQMASRLENTPLSRMNEWKRLSGAALLPYHFGRGCTYVGLGALGGMLARSVVSWDAFHWVPVALLILAALFLLCIAYPKFFPRHRTERPPRPEAPSPGDSLRGAELQPRTTFSPGRSVFILITNPARRFLKFCRHGWRKKRPHPKRLLDVLFRNPVGWRGWVLGICLGFLPCGFLYAALAAAASSSSALNGAMAMASFTAGTALPLMAVGLVGHVAGTRWKNLTIRSAPWLLTANAGMLLLMAWKAAQ